MARIEWHPIAQNQLNDISEFINSDRAGAGKTFARRIVDAVQRLRDYPESGRVIPGADEDAFREVIVDSYRVMYGVLADRVIILAVIHGARDFRKEDLPHD